jgi:hypothetical protein
MRSLQLMVFCLVGLHAFAVFGQIPNTMSYQGVLSDTGGNPLPDGDYDIIFRIYDQEGGGTPIWQELQSVTTGNGIFDIILGSKNALNIPFDRQYYLGLTIGDAAELAPRIALTSAPYSLTAGTVAAGGAVHSLNQLTDDVILTAEGGAAISTRGDTIVIAVTNGSNGGGIASLDQAYNAGGPGLGRTIVANSGAVNIAGSDGLTVAGEIGVGTDSIGIVPLTNFEIVDDRFARLSMVATEPDDDVKLLIDARGDGESDRAQIATISNHDLTFLTNDAVKMTIKTEGNVGIGTLEPASRLHVLDATTESDSAAIVGQHDVSDFFGIGIRGKGGWVGVEGIVDGSGEGEYFGVVASASTTAEIGTTIGVWGEASGGDEPWAGFFNGDVQVTGTLFQGAGSMRIDHPEDPANKYLIQSYVVSAEQLCVFNGKTILGEDGTAVVRLPDYVGALAEDFRYQLTAIGGPAPDLHISAELEGAQFEIAGGAAGLKVSWQVSGKRLDALAASYNGEAEITKPERERGTFLNPQLYSQPKQSRIYGARQGKKATGAAEASPPAANDDGVGGL